MTLMVKLERELTEEFLADILDVAFDGGYPATWMRIPSAPALEAYLDKFREMYPNRTVLRRGWHYWFQTDDGMDRTLAFVVQQRGGEYEIGKPAIDKSAGWPVDYQGIRNAIQHVLDTYKKDSVLYLAVLNAVSEMDAGPLDAGTADDLVQIASYGESVFS